MDAVLNHDLEGHRFTGTVDGHEGYLKYSPISQGLVDFQSTFVPPEARGQGLAGKIVERALGWARSEGLRVIPTCWYVAQYIERNPEYQDLVAER